MSRRIAAGVAALVAAAATGLGASAAGATEPTPTQPVPAVDGGAVPLSPDQAEALVTAQAAVPSGETTTLVSGDAALAASALPGADTSVDPELGAAGAVGLVAPGDASVAIGLSSPSIWCWADRAWWEWGTWPYEQRLIDTTYWCALYGKRLTYRTTTVTTSGTLCGTDWRADAVIAGGIGFHGMTIRSSAGFACPTIVPWVTLHPTRHLDVLRNDRGGAAIVGRG